MPDEFGTVNIRRSGNRDLEVLRKQYHQHRETLLQLASEAPSEFLAAEYLRLIRDIELSLKKVDEMQRGTGASASAAATAAAVTGAAPSKAGDDATMRLRAGSRPLTPPPATFNERSDASPNPALRVAMILIAGVAVLAVVGWLIWRSSIDRPVDGAVVDQTVTNTEPIVETGTIEAASPRGAEGWKLSTRELKFGIVRRGTRVVRQIEITNTSDEPISVALERSGCRCLFYEYADEIKPNTKESITVSLDGARAKVGELRESIDITSKADPSVKTSFEVTANIK